MQEWIASLVQIAICYNAHAVYSAMLNTLYEQQKT